MGDGVMVGMMTTMTAAASRDGVGANAKVGKLLCECVYVWELKVL